MEMVLVARETVVHFFKRFEVIFMPIIKLFLGYFVFSRILAIDHSHEIFDTFSEAMSTGMLSWLFALLFVVMPANLTWILIIFTITVQVSAFVEIAVAVFVFLLLIFLFYGRMAVKESYLILLTVLAFSFNLQFLVPLIVGLYFPLTAVIPIIIGVFITTQIPVVFELMETPMIIDFADVEFPDLMTELPAVFTEAYSNVMEGILGSYNWVFIAMIFAMVIVAVYLVSRQAINYSREIAIGVGCGIIIFGYILFNVATDETVSLLGVIGWTILSGLIAVIIRLFDSVLDYRKVEAVQFEDDDNYYHVKIVPKVIMSKPKHDRDEKYPPVRQPDVRREPVAKREPDVRREPVAKREPDVRREPVAKREPDRREYETRRESDVRREPEARHEPDVRREPKARHEPDVRREPGARREPPEGRI